MSHGYGKKLCTIIKNAQERYCQMLWIDTSLAANTDGGFMN